MLWWKWTGLRILPTVCRQLWFSNRRWKKWVAPLNKTFFQSSVHQCWYCLAHIKCFLFMSGVVSCLRAGHLAIQPASRSLHRMVEASIIIPPTVRSLWRPKLVLFGCMVFVLAKYLSIFDTFPSLTTFSHPSWRDCPHFVVGSNNMWCVWFTYTNCLPNISDCFRYVLVQSCYFGTFPEHNIHCLMPHAHKHPLRTSFTLTQLLHSNMRGMVFIDLTWLAELCIHHSHGYPQLLSHSYDKGRKKNTPLF